VYDFLIADALRRREIFDNLPSYLRRLKMLVLKVDPRAELYLFGSVAEGRHTYSSDIDVLIITEKDRWEILKTLVKEEFTSFFDIHVRKPEEARWYRRMAKLTRI